MGGNREALELHVVYKTSYFVLQVTQTIHIRHYKSLVLHLNMQSNMIKSLSLDGTELYRKNITRLSPLTLLLVLHTHNNMDDNSWYSFVILK